MPLFHSSNIGFTHFLRETIWETIQDVLLFYKSLKTTLFKKDLNTDYIFQNFGWDEEDILRTNFPDLKLTNTDGTTPLKEQLNTSKLCVVNYHSVDYRNVWLQTILLSVFGILKNGR